MFVVWSHKKKKQNQKDIQTWNLSLVKGFLTTGLSRYCPVSTKPSLSLINMQYWCGVTVHQALKPRQSCFIVASASWGSKNGKAQGGVSLAAS